MAKYFGTQAAAQTSTDAYADVDETLIVVGPGERLVARFFETAGANGITIQCLARRWSTGAAGTELSDFVAIPTASAMAIAADDQLTFDSALFIPEGGELKFQVKATTPGSQGNLECYGAVDSMSAWPDTITGAFNPTA